MKRDVYPLTLYLPDGTHAEYVPGSRPPQYEVNGEPIAVDVSIPPDLEATGWYWSGSFLCQPYAPGDTRGICIITSLVAPPGWDYTADGRCRVPGPWPSIYQTARWFDERWSAYQAEKAAKAEQLQKKPKKARKAPVDKASALELLRTTEAAWVQEGMGL